MTMLNIPDFIIEPEPTPFDEARRGWHSGVLTQLPVPILNQILSFLEATDVDDAVERINTLNRDDYIQYLIMLPNE